MRIGAPSRPRRLLWCAALALAVVPAVHAASITSCTVTATNVVFGTYTPLQAAALTSTAMVSIACTGVTGRNTVTIDLSAGASGSYTTRTLISGAAKLNYNLYQDAANTEIWGNGTGGSTQASTTIRKAVPDATLTVYGSVAALQDPAPGSYGDSITVTVNY
ncbi:MAG TPA: spore coat U domain-containing protein [Steroidobacteraceae bacterium]|jgi:spore coat protein U-like protein|nr:spore coat U domain-containing protein [Steroidobacteraceae bacterium]